MSENEKDSLQLRGLSNTEIAMIYEVMEDFFESSVKAIEEANISRRKNCLMVQMMVLSAQDKGEKLNDETKALIVELTEETEAVFGYELEIPKHHVHYNTIKEVLAKLKPLVLDIYEAEPEVEEYVTKRTIDDNPEAIKSLTELLKRLQESLDKNKE